jgi:hypothetical protein
MSDENPFIMPPERLERLREKLFDAEGKYWSAGVKKNKKKVCPFGAHESMNRIKTAKVAPGDSLVIEGVIVFGNREHESVLVDVRKCPACAHVDVQRLSGAAKTAVANDHWERMIYRQLNDLTATASPAYSIWENYNPPEGTS